VAKKKTTTRKTAKKPAASSPAGKSSATQRSAKKSASQTAKSKKAQVKKAKSATKKTTGKKNTGKKKVAKKKTSAKKPTVKSTPAKKAVSKKSLGKKASTRTTTAKKNPAQKTTGNPGARTAEQHPAPPPMKKTRLNVKQLNAFKDMLLAKRAELLTDVRMLTKDALGKSRKDSAGDLSSMPIHMADIGSDNWEQDFTLGLIANERQLVREIDEALARIENRTYGVCVATQKPITVARLRAKPWARYCIEYARQLESGGR
jgi:DnaK suppressor protein